jgi:hypothetical protein
MVHDLNSKGNKHVLDILEQKGRKSRRDSFDWRSDEVVDVDVKAPLPGNFQRPLIRVSTDAQMLQSLFWVFHGMTMRHLWVGGFKSMKSRWLSEYEREQREQGIARQGPEAAPEPLIKQKEADMPALKEATSRAEASHLSSAKEPGMPGSEGETGQCSIEEAAEDPAQDPVATSAQHPSPAGGLDIAELPTADAAEQELALVAEANALAELADSDSEGNRGLQGSIADVIVNSPPAPASGQGAMCSLACPIILLGCHCTCC